MASGKQKDLLSQNNVMLSMVIKALSGFRIVLFTFCIIFAACTKDVGHPLFCDVNSSSYSSVIAPILSSKCSVPGCHGPTSPFGNLTVYSNVKSKIEKGSFQKMIFEIKAMPPKSKDSLTVKEKQLIQCWLQRGSPQD